MRHLKYSILLLATVLMGCEHYEKTTSQTEVIHEPAAPTVVAPAPTPVRTLDSVILDVRDAPDAGAEAAALHRLHDWLSDHQMTYRVGVVDSTGHPVQAATLAKVPVTVSMSIFQQRQPVRDFSFVPKDNRNLAIIGVQ